MFFMGMIVMAFVRMGILVVMSFVVVPLMIRMIVMAFMVMGLMVVFIMTVIILANARDRAVSSTETEQGAGIIQDCLRRGDAGPLVIRARLVFKTVEIVSWCIELDLDCAIGLNRDGKLSRAVDMRTQL